MGRGYPNMSLVELMKAAGVDDQHDLTESQATAATQLAVWRFSNGIELATRYDKIGTEGRKIALAVVVKSSETGCV